MRDAVGGSVIIAIILFFIVIVLAYLAFNVNYTKAFRMRDKVIAIYNDYNGSCNDICKKEIEDYAKNIGYDTDGLTCPEGFDPYKDLYCYKKVELTINDPDGDSISDLGVSTYYVISTRININVPVINNLLNLRILYLSGDTKIYAIK